HVCHLLLLAFFIQSPSLIEIYSLSLHDALPIWVGVYAYRSGSADGAGLISVDNFQAEDLADDEENPDPANQDPVAQLSASVTDLTVDVDGSGSSDPDGTIVSYVWDWGGGADSCSCATASPYATRVRSYPSGSADAAGLISADTFQAEDLADGGENPDPANQDPVAQLSASVTDLTVDVDGSGSSDPDGTIES